MARLSRVDICYHFCNTSCTMNDPLTDEQLAVIEDHALNSSHEIGGGVVLRLINEIRDIRKQLAENTADLVDAENALADSEDEKDRLEVEVFDLEGEVVLLDKKLAAVHEALK